MFPKNILQSILLIISAFLICSPIFIIFRGDDFEYILFLILFILVLLGSYFYLNRKRRIRISFMPNGLKLIYFLFFTVFQLGISIPFNNYGQSLVENPFPEFWKVIAIITLGPLAEEFSFRQVILGSIRNTYSETKSIIFSSILFAVIHEPKIMPIAFILGCILGKIYVKNNNLGNVFVLHAFANLITLVFNYLYFRYNISSIGNINYILLASIVLCSIISFFIIRKIINPHTTIKTT